MSKPLIVAKNRAYAGYWPNSMIGDQYVWYEPVVVLGSESIVFNVYTSTDELKPSCQLPETNAKGFEWHSPCDIPRTETDAEQLRADHISHLLEIWLGHNDTKLMQRRPIAPVPPDQVLSNAARPSITAPLEQQPLNMQDPPWPVDTILSPATIESLLATFDGPDLRMPTGLTTSIEPAPPLPHNPLFDFQPRESAVACPGPIDFQKHPIDVAGNITTHTNTISLHKISIPTQPLNIANEETDSGDRPRSLYAEVYRGLKQAQKHLFGWRVELIKSPIKVIQKQVLEGKCKARETAKWTNIKTTLEEDRENLKEWRAAHLKRGVPDPNANWEQKMGLMEGMLDAAVGGDIAEYQGFMKAALALPVFVPRK